MLFLAVKVRKHINRDKSRPRDFIAEAVGTIVGIIFFLAIVYSVYVYCKRKATFKDAVLYKQRAQQQNEQSRDPNCHNGGGAEPIYEPLTFKPNENEYQTVPCPPRVPPPYPGCPGETPSERFIEPTAPPISEHYSEIGQQSLGVYANTSRQAEKR